MRNTITMHVAPLTSFSPTFYSVQAISADGAPYTFAVIHRNKHGRSNLTGVGRSGRFIAGGRSARAIEKYARTVDPNTTRRVFIEARGVIVDLEAVAHPASIPHG